MNTNQVVTLGNIMVDYVCDLTPMPLAELYSSIESNATIFSPIAMHVGGSGLLFAAAAKEMGFAQSTLIGKIGGRTDMSGELIPDLPGSIVVDFLRQSGVVPLVAISPKVGTGCAFLNYLASDRRLMIADPLANTTFSPEDISPEMDAIVRQADLFYVSGYTLIHPNSRATARELMRRAKGNGGRIAVNLVPHNFYKHMSLEELQECIGDLANWVFMEIPLAHQLTGLGQIEREKFQSVVDLLLETMVSSGLPIAVFVLSPEHHHLVYWNGNQRCDYSSQRQGRDDASNRGFTSLIQAEFLVEQFKAHLV